MGRMGIDIITIRPVERTFDWLMPGLIKVGRDRRLRRDRRAGRRGLRHGRALGSAIVCADIDVRVLFTGIAIGLTYTSGPVIIAAVTGAAIRLAASTINVFCGLSKF